MTARAKIGAMGISQTALAEKMGIGVHSLNRKLWAKRKFKPEERKRLIQLLELDPSLL